MEWLTSGALLAIVTWAISALKEKFGLKGAGAFWLALGVCFVVAIPATLIAGQWGIVNFDFLDPPTFVTQLVTVFGIIFAGAQVLYNAWKVTHK